MRKGFVVLLAAVLVAAFALPAMADVSFFGTARVMPTYYSNFDFDDNAPDLATLNEGGFTSGEHIRGELRLGWKAGGDKWKIMMIAESDLIFNKNNVDRSYYTNSVFSATNTVPNAGAEFGIERAEFSYAFTPAFELFTGWPISAVDIGTGGLLYGDDHPIFGFRGKVTDNFKYQLVYISIQNTPQTGASTNSTLTGDWRAYFLKPEFSFGTASAKGTVSPILLFSDNRANNAQIWYYGLEAIAQIGMIKPSFEVIYADGEFRNTPRDIKSYAAFAGVELALNKAFNPYIAGRYTRGDDNDSDNDVEGFVGITDIGRFTPLMGMDGNILGENLAFGAAGLSPYNSPLYSYEPGRTFATNRYGGISNLSSGDNPGSKIIAVGAKGSLADYAKGLSYKAQVFGIWFDQTENLSVGAGKTVSKVDTYAGTTFDLQLKYDFSPNFSATYIGSVFLPGDGIKDQQATTADDTFGSVNTVQLAWTY